MNSENAVILKEQSKSEPFMIDCAKRAAIAQVLNSNSYSPDRPDRLLGVDWYDRERSSIQAKYYIGLKWITEGESYLFVKPKIENLDFMSMFMHCFDNQCKDVVSKLGKIYSIDFHAKPIKIDTAEYILTPMLIAHFLKLTESIVKKGLKYNYIQREDNLSSKIKGKILVGQTIKRNHSVGRIDRTICKYQDYSADCIENRVIKKTLQFVEKFINVHNDISCSDDLKQITAFCLGAMRAVSDNISLQQIKQFKVNPLYKEYADALKVAQLILKRFSYDIELVNSDSEKYLPPFWIDMSLLFEIYVYSMLKISYHHNIKHQLRTYGNAIDFVKFDEKLIIDTKYIPSWQEKVKHDNIRQLSGYARNIVLREHITQTKKDETSILDCVIIYPNQSSGIERFGKDRLMEDVSIVDTYLKFHKLSVKLPIKGDLMTSSDDEDIDKYWNDND